MKYATGHPAGHISFASTHNGTPLTVIEVPQFHGRGMTEQMLWPDHCIQGTYGSECEEGVKERLDRLGEKVEWIRKVGER